MKTILLTTTVAVSLLGANVGWAAQAQPPKAEPNMQKVLDALASLNGKPIETTPTPPTSGCLPTPSNSTAMPHAWRSAAKARAAIWRRWCR